MIESAYPVEFFCKTCNKKRISSVQHKAGWQTWLCCCGLCITSAMLLFLPFYLRECKSTEHYCPSCQSAVGVKEFEACGCRMC